MKFENRNLIDEVAALGMPDPEGIVINHGAALVIRGIRPEHADGDIDMIASYENIQYLEQELGFRAVKMVVGISRRNQERTVMARRDPKNRFDVHRWDFSMYRYNRTGEGRLYLPESIEMSDQDEKTRIRVAQPKLVKLTKLETGRPKDVEDVELIDRHLAA